MSAPWRPLSGHESAATVPTVPDAAAAPVEFVPGDEFILDDGPTLVARWGTPDETLWACGESLMIVAPSGVGKTTLAIQLVEALVGVSGSVLGLPVMPCRRVLYLAMDRPRQIRRAFRRRLGTVSADVLRERLVFRKGPLPTDLTKVPDQLVTLARAVGADVVVVDSLKDACSKLSDEEGGAQVNRAVQLANADGIDLVVLHHQKKGQAGVAPSRLDDVFGSVWLTAGAGSVVLLWGETGGDTCELRHLKQPADAVGPWNLDHDHTTGVMSRQAAFDVLAYVRQHPAATVAEVARAEHGGDVKAGSAAYKRTERRLKKLVRQGLLTCPAQVIVGAEVRYRPVDVSRGHPQVTDPYPLTVDAP